MTGAIDGVRVVPLRRIPDQRGVTLHMLRADAPHFERFGEIYFSAIFPGIVKGWRVHSRMTMNLAVPVGSIRLAMYDDREGSPTRGTVMALDIGEANYQLVTVPPGVWNAFKGLGASTTLVANCATEPHDPAEVTHCDPFTNHIPYDWSATHG
jgi:dTDP-4-dehydrorhamnose 3,5-epimerase